MLDGFDGGGRELFGTETRTTLLWTRALSAVTTVGVVGAMAGLERPRCFWPSRLRRLCGCTGDAQAAPPEHHDHQTAFWRRCSPRVGHRGVLSVVPGWRPGEGDVPADIDMLPSPARSSAVHDEGRHALSVPLRCSSRAP